MKSLVGAFNQEKALLPAHHRGAATVSGCSRGTAAWCSDSWTTEATQLQVPAECSHAVTVEVEVEANTEELPRMIVEEANGF